MTSGLSGRVNLGDSKGFHFGSDDVLCSYEDYGNQESSNGDHAVTETAIGANNNSSSKDFNNDRATRSMFPPNAYGQPDDTSCSDVTVTVEETVKKHFDILMRFLEGISSRLSQLELYCYNLDKSIGEMRSDLVRDNEDADSKLKSIEKHIQEVHRSVQILKDKQDLAETQKLAKLHLVHKEPSSSSHSQSTEERASETDHASEMQNQQLALALPHQVAPPQQQQPVSPHSQAPPRNLTQQSYYIPSNQLSNLHSPAPDPVHVPSSSPSQHTQGHYLPPDPQYQTPHVKDVSRMPSQLTQTHQVPQVQSFPQYQQQWPQQLPPQVQQQQQQSSTQPQMRPPSTPAYLPYPPTQSNPSPEALQHSTPMQVSYSGVPQPMSSRVDTVPYGYGRTPPQQMKGTFEAQPRDEYQASGSHPSLPPGSAYTMYYDREGGRTHHPYNVMVRNGGSSQYVRNHPYNDLIDKLASMGFRGDHVVGVIQRMEESGQPVDFNAVLDRLNAHPAGGSQRGGW